MLTARAPRANVGPDRALPYVGPCPGLNHCAYLSWNSSSCTPVRPRPNPLYWPLLKFTRPGEDCAVMGEHADRQGSSGCQLTAYSFPWPLLPALALAGFRVPTPGSCHDTGTCSWPPQPSVLTQSAFLPWSLAAGLAGTTQGPSSSWNHCRLPAVLTKDMQLVILGIPVTRIEETLCL